MANVGYPGGDVIRDEDTRDDRSGKEIAAGGSFTEALLGVAAVVLAILGLTGTMPFTFASIGMLLVGLALLLEGGAIATRIYRLYDRLGLTADSDLSGGLSAEILAGIAGITLGVLALLGVSILVLLPVAAIVVGTGVLFGSAATARASSIAITGPVIDAKSGTKLARDSIATASGAQVLVGIASIVLGILALLDFSPLTLSLVAVLALGATNLLAGAVVGGRLMSTLRHR
jgi:hypothetical protein